MSKNLHAACAAAHACAGASPPSTMPWLNVIADNSRVTRHLPCRVDHGQATFLRLGSTSIKLLASCCQATFRRDPNRAAI
jgi:hypothetical protein